MPKRKGKKGKSAAATDIKDTVADRKMKTKKFPCWKEKKHERDGLRMKIFNRQREEEELAKGMSIRNIFLQEQGLIVKDDEDKSEKCEFDAYEHAMKVVNGKISYPTRPPSFAGHSVSSDHPVRGMMRKITRKTITKVITVLEEEVRNEEARKKVDMLFETWYSRNDPATRRTKAMMQKSMGKKYIPFVMREEKLCFLHQPHQNSVVHSCKDRASSRAKAMLQKCLVQKS
jgi:hypothetical protein